MNDSSIVASLVKGMSRYRIINADIYILTKTGVRGKRLLQSLQMWDVSDLFLVSHRCFSYVMPSCYGHHAAEPKTNCEIIHTLCLERISPVFISVVSVNVAVALQPEH